MFFDFLTLRGARLRASQPLASSMACPRMLGFHDHHNLDTFSFKTTSSACLSWRSRRDAFRSSTQESLAPMRSPASEMKPWPDVLPRYDSVAVAVASLSCVLECRKHHHRLSGVRPPYHAANCTVVKSKNTHAHQDMICCALATCYRVHGVFCVSLVQDTNN